MILKSEHHYFYITEANMCTPLSAPTNGALVETDAMFAVGATLSFTCSAGFTVTGTNPITCLAAGTFDASAPTCGKRNIALRCDGYRELVLIVSKIYCCLELKLLMCGCFTLTERQC
jgi:hypothetical protein